MVALLEPFIDTVVICTMTALVIVITGVLNVDPETGLYVWNAEAGRISTTGEVAGVELTSAAYAQAFSWFPALLAIAVVLFAFSTMISWSYYGDRCATYLFGTRAVVPYRIVYVGMVFLGTVIAPAAAWDLGDIALGIVILPNLLALIMLSGKTRQLMDSYFERQPWLSQPHE
mgnify:CR=1 FL=1